MADDDVAAATVREIQSALAEMRAVERVMISILNRPDASIAELRAVRNEMGERLARIEALVARKA